MDRFSIRSRAIAEQALERGPSAFAWRRTVERTPVADGGGEPVCPIEIAYRMTTPLIKTEKQSERFWKLPGRSAQEEQPRRAQHHPQAGPETKALAIEEGPDGQQDKCNHIVAGERSKVQLQTGAIADEVA